MVSPPPDQEARRKLLQAAAKRLGGNARLGRKLGYYDGAFIGQMLRGERPISEKTVEALRSVPQIRDLLANATSILGYVPADAAPASGPAAPALIDALPVVLDALAAAPERAELRSLLPLLADTDAPAYRQRLAELLGAARAAPKRRVADT